MSAPLSPKLDWELANPLWAQTLNPVLATPFLSGKAIVQINLKTGTNIINHGLGRMLRGWFPIDETAAATIYRSAPKNALTLTLTSNAVVTVDLWVF